MSLAPSALVQLDSSCELFAANAVGFKAEKVLVSAPFPICPSVIGGLTALRRAL